MADDASTTAAADEVKIFRRLDDDDADAEPSLADDKKDVALEEEMESKPSILGGKGAFQPAGLSSPTFNPMSVFGSISPAYAYAAAAAVSNYNFMANQAMMQQMQRTLSPNLMTLGQFMPALSPTFELLAAQQRIHAALTSPLTGTKPGVPTTTSATGVPLPASMRHSGGPLNQMNQMMPPYMMAQMAHAHLAASAGGNNHASAASSSSHGSAHKKPRIEKEPKDKHIKFKKPMNAFMWYMKENRPKLMEELEYKEKQSAELNKELGKRWQELDKDEQQRYYEMAKRDKEDHQKRFPNWTARDNYAIHKKKKKKRDRAIESGEAKKCRARFGLTNVDAWCAPCRRKKKCIFSSANDELGGGSGGPSSVGGHSSNGVGGGGFCREDDDTETSPHSAQQRASDSESELDDDPMATDADCLEDPLVLKMKGA